MSIGVRGTFNGTQQYAVHDAEDRELARGEISGAGVIRFDTEAGEKETVFTVELPDAAKVSDVSGDSRDYRKIALQISGIGIRLKEKEETADRAALPLYGKTVLLAGDSRSSDDYTFYREALERKSGCTAVTAGASGKTAAYNATDEYLSYILGQPHDFSVWLVGGNDDGSPGTVGTFDASSALAAQGEPVVGETDAAGEDEAMTFIQAVDRIMRTYLRESERMREQGGKVAVLECCEKNGVACLDLYTLCGFDMSKEPTYTPPTDMVHDRGVYFMDGLHPNPRGTDVIADHEIRFMEALSAGDP